MLVTNKILINYSFKLRILRSMELPNQRKSPEDGHLRSQLRNLIPKTLTKRKMKMKKMMKKAMTNLMKTNQQLKNQRNRHLLPPGEVEVGAQQRGEVSRGGGTSKEGR